MPVRRPSPACPATHRRGTNDRHVEVFAACPGLRSHAASTQNRVMIRVRSLDHFVLRVRDLDASLRFYRDMLGLAAENEAEYRQGARPFVSLRVGEQLLDLVPDSTYDGTAGGGFLHFCVTV